MKVWTQDLKNGLINLNSGVWLNFRSNLIQVCYWRYCTVKLVTVNGNQELNDSLLMVGRLRNVSIDKPEESWGLEEKNSEIKLWSTNSERVEYGDNERLKNLVVPCELVSSLSKNSLLRSKDGLLNMVPKRPRNARVNLYEPIPWADFWRVYSLQIILLIYPLMVLSYIPVRPN